MLTFKQFKLVTEALRNKDKENVNQWKKGDNSFTDHIFGGPDKDKETHQRRYFDFHDETDVESPHKQEISQHLEKHGYKIKNYKKGVVSDNFGREVRLGKALGRTGADVGLVKKFNEDPARTAATNEKPLKILLTRHPHDVAGMSSCGYSWDQSSCMNFDSGAHRNRLPQDVKHGTHVAYLVHADEEGHPQRPLARIAIKKHTTKDGNHHLLVPEYRVYGDAPEGFHKQVTKILDKEHNQHQPSGTYIKHPSVYDDTGRSEHHHFGKDLDNAVKSGSDSVRLKALNHPDIQSHHIDDILEGPRQSHSLGVRAEAIKHPKAHSRHLDAAIKSTDEQLFMAAFKSPNIQPHHIELGLNSYSTLAQRIAARHPKAQAHHLDKALTDTSSSVRTAAVENKNAQSHHLDKGLEDPEGVVRAAAAGNKNAQSHHLDKALSDDDFLFGVQVRMAAANNPNAQSHHLDKALTDSSSRVRELAAGHPNAQSHHLDKALEDNDPSDGFRIRRIAAAHPNAQSHHLDKALNDHDPIHGHFVRNMAVLNKNAQRHHIEKGLKDPHPTVRDAAMHRKRQMQEQGLWSEG